MNQFNTPKTLVNEIEAAQILGLCPTTLRRWRWAGTGPSFLKMGGLSGMTLRSWTPISKRVVGARPLILERSTK